jgi:hypothetical protein
MTFYTCTSAAKRVWRRKLIEELVEDESLFTWALQAQKPLGVTVHSCKRIRFLTHMFTRVLFFQFLDELFHNFIARGFHLNVDSLVANRKRV